MVRTLRRCKAAAPKVTDFTPTKPEAMPRIEMKIEDNEDEKEGRQEHVKDREV